MAGKRSKLVHYATTELFSAIVYSLVSVSKRAVCISTLVEIISMKSK